MNAFDEHGSKGNGRRRVLGLAAASGALAALFPLANAQAAKRIRFAHPAPTAHAWLLWAEEFKKSIESKTGGKVTVQIFPNAQMGNERDTAQAVRIGSIEMGAIGVGLMNWVPEMSIRSEERRVGKECEGGWVA